MPFLRLLIHVAVQPKRSHYYTLTRSTSGRPQTEALSAYHVYLCNVELCVERPQSLFHRFVTAFLINVSVPKSLLISSLLPAMVEKEVQTAKWWWKPLSLATSLPVHFKVKNKLTLTFLPVTDLKWIENRMQAPFWKIHMNTPACLPRPVGKWQRQDDSQLCKRTLSHEKGAIDGLWVILSLPYSNL